MKIMFTVIVALCIAAVVLMLVAVRTASHDPAEWHVDPITFVDPTTPNFYRVGPSDRMSMNPQVESPIYVGSPQLLAEAFDTFVMGKLRVQRINADVDKAIDEAWITYVQTSPQVGFPDYISVKFIDNGDGSSRVALISRSRYGHGDLGVNEARVTEWLPGLNAFTQEAGATSDDDDLQGPGDESVPTENELTDGSVLTVDPDPEPEQEIAPAPEIVPSEEPEVEEPATNQ